MTGLTENGKSKLFLLAALMFIALAIIGGVRGYSPVPFWDMWDGYLGFFVKVMSGDVSAWWAQHNEHRIVLARCFFWIDFFLFEGRGWFLIVINYLLLSFVCILFWAIWKESKDEKDDWIIFFIIAWLFWWIQKNNLEWGFQSQFILAQLLPLAALYFLHLSVGVSSNLNKWFVLAVAVGFLSIGSMANGVLALPIMVVYAVLTRMQFYRIVILSGTSVLSIVAYFYDYVSPVGHGSLAQAIYDNPLGLLHYVIVYVGGAFSFGDNRLGLWSATFAGTLLIIGSILFTIKVIPRAKQKTLPLALLAFILYIGGTAIGTAGGRLIFGVEQALASRYMTPSLMAWVAFFILTFDFLKKLSKNYRKKLWIPFLLLLILMLPIQLDALSSKKEQNFERKVAAIAIELSVKDREQVGHVFPSVDWAIAISEKPKEYNLSIFGFDYVKNASDLMGTQLKYRNKPLGSCVGNYDSTLIIEGESNYLKINGWIFNSKMNKAPDVAVIINESGHVYGYVLTGWKRLDVSNAIGKNAEFSGFKGYLSAEYKSDKEDFYLLTDDCILPIFISGVRN